MASYCKVNGCRFPFSHTTPGHLCGTCNGYGHGRIECGNPDEISKLPKTDILPISMHCTMDGCVYKWSHTNRAHNCSKCGRNHHSRDCIISFASDHEMFRNIRVEEHLAEHDNVYTIRSAGMGCMYYIRKKDGIIEVLFMHSDALGQYGAETDDSPICERFVAGMRLITCPFVDDMDKTTIICPICRTEVQKDTVCKVKGASDNCSICYDNHVEVYFPECEHACVCTGCFEKI